MGNRAAITRELARVGREAEFCVLAYLFGSQVGERVGPLSDVDVAVLLDTDGDELQVRTELRERLCEVDAIDDLDLVILNDVPVELAYNVIATGERAYERSISERVDYESYVLGRYGDYLPILRQQRRDILEAEGHERRVQRYREAIGRARRARGEAGGVERTRPGGV
jgi:predicted nucleotidyltransferase